MAYSNDVRAGRLAVAALVAASMCGCGTSDEPPRGDPPASVASVRPSPAASQQRAPSPSPTSVLADLLPTSLDGVELHTFPVGGDLIDRLASTLGVELSAIEAAYASEHGARFFQTYALRVSGIDGPRLLEAFAASAYDPEEGEVTLAAANVGGRSVTVVTQSSTAARLGTFYAYVADDALLVVQSFDPLVADEVIAALP